MLIVCYRDLASGATGYDELEGRFSDATERDWLAANPGKAVQFVFDGRDELRAAESVRADGFFANCARYGFRPDEYGAKLVFPDRQGVFSLVGFRPNARKYTCVCRSDGTGKIVRCTEDYARKLMAMYGRAQAINPGATA